MSGPNDSPLSVRCRRRRTLLQVIAAASLGVPRLGAADDEAGDASPPQENDWLVFAFGDRAGETITPGDLALGAKQVFAYPQDATTGEVRSGNRLNQVVVVRLDATGFTRETLARSVDGVVAYSGVCSHTGCDVTDWFADVRRFKCPCHESEFDPSDGARVIGGPAPWQLAALPLKIVDGKLAVAGAFEGRLGFQQPGSDPFSPL
jgi:Rieske Fe-S protein